MKKQPLATQIMITGKKTHRCFDAFLAENCDDLLRPDAGRVLGYLSMCQKASTQEIQERFGLAKASLSECLSLLEGRGLVDYRKSESDGREKIVELTPLGVARAEEFHQLVLSFNGKITENLTEEEIKTLSSLLDKVQKQVEVMSYGEQSNG